MSRNIIREQLARTTIHFYEVYLKGPNDEPGWTIEVGQIVNAKDGAHARRALSDHYGEDLDEVISLYEVATKIEHIKKVIDL